MKKLLREINRNIDKDITGKERKDLLNYYEEIISDRLENGESIVAIRKSLLKDFSNNNETNLKHNNSTLFSILMIPFIIIFGLIGLSIIISIGAILFSLAVSGLAIMFANILAFIEIIISNADLSLKLFVSGANLFIFALILLLIRPFIKGVKRVTIWIFDILKLIFNKIKVAFGGN